MEKDDRVNERTNESDMNESLEPLNPMRIWERVKTTRPEDTKEVSYGARHFTSVSAHSQLKKATELWGPFCVP